MANIIGKSGAWKSVSKNMASIGFQIQEISDISKILTEEKSKAIEAEETKEKLLEKEKQDFSQKNKELDEGYQKAVDRNKGKIIENANRIVAKIHQLQEPVSFFKKPKQKIQLARKRRELKKFKQKSIDYLEDLKSKRDTERKRLAGQYKAKVFEIEGKARNIKFNVEMLQNLLASPELVGALAELKMIKKLRSLPNNYYVLNDVQLSLEKAMRFDNKWRKTAQIDTLVISPAGIFVIEVKNWSKEFTQTDNYHNPYDQVKWAAYLCYKQTGIKSRSIIAHTGNIPPKLEGSYAKALPINEVNGYILYFREKIISDEKIGRIANQLNQKRYLL